MRRIIFMLAILASTALTIPSGAQEVVVMRHPEGGQASHEAATKKQKREVGFWGRVEDAVTHQGIPGVHVTLMTADSTVLDTLTVNNWGTMGGTKTLTQYRFGLPHVAQKYIILAEHPDYEPCYVDYEVKVIARNTWFDDTPPHRMKRRMKSENVDYGELGAVTIKATKVKMVFKGDTIVYNADAFNLPDGSMLDALIRQLDGVELKDNGQILVNGQQIDELLLNGKDFFRGNRRILLDNLPNYTVNNVQVYHKTTEKSEWMGEDVEPKKYVMDVVLKREYAQGWLSNIELAGGSPFGERSADGKRFDDRYLARLFGMRYTDNSRFTVFANTNNVNESRKPGSNGEWTPSNMPTGQRTTRHAGMDLLIDEKDKRWKENASVELSWNRYSDISQTSAESFLANSSSTFSRSLSNSLSKNLKFSASNTFTLQKPFWLSNSTNFTYTENKSHGDNTAINLLTDPRHWGTVRESLDSAFSASLSLEKQAELVNRNRSRTRNDGTNIEASTNTDISHKLITGDVAGVTLSGIYERAKGHSHSLQRIDYLQTEGQNTLQNRYTRTPSHSYYMKVSPYYTIRWFNGITLKSSYTFNVSDDKHTNDTYLLDRLGGSYAAESFGFLPSTRDSLLIAFDANNSNEQDQLTREHTLTLTPQYKYDKNGKYIWVSSNVRGKIINERLRYNSAATDTTLRQNKQTLTANIYGTFAFDNWKKHFSFEYSYEMLTPSLQNMVDVRNDQDPLNIRLGNPHLKGATNHRSQISFSRRWNAHSTSLTFGYGLRFFLNQVSQGYTYDTHTGIRTYRPENVDGNWQTYFFHYFGRTIDKDRRLSLNNYTHGDYSRNVDLAMSGNETENGLMTTRLSHVNNWYLEDRLSLNYRFDDLSIGSQIYGEYRHATNKEHTIATIDAVDFSYGLTFGYNFQKDSYGKLLKGWSLNTDIKMFSRRGYGDKSINTDDLVWNASLSRSFPRPFGSKAGGTLVARLEAFDILHQLSNTTVWINGQGRTETIRNTLPRYVMLHLTYNFLKNPKKR